MIFIFPPKFSIVRQEYLVTIENCPFNAGMIVYRIIRLKEVCSVGSKVYYNCH